MKNNLQCFLNGFACAFTIIMAFVLIVLKFFK
jgi:hypothetical protein